MQPSSLIVILVRPQLAENIGAAARAMANFGLNQMRLVAPQAYDKTVAAKVACHGRPVLDQVQVYTTLREALADCVFSVATSRRLRRVKLPPLTPKNAAGKLVDLGSRQPGALVFGAERAGLTNEEIYLCDTASTIPTAKEGSLNLGQAVLLYLYEWFLAAHRGEVTPSPEWSRLATFQEKQQTFDLLDQLLQKSGYQPMARLPEFSRKVKYLFEKRALSRRENQILLKLLRFLEKLG